MYMGFRDSRKSRDENHGLEVLYESNMFADHADLRDCLVGYMHGDAEPEKACKISIWVAEGRVKICVSDEENDQIAFGTLDPSKRLGEALNAVLHSGDLDWKPNKNSKRR
jgi:hypothetical protein